MNHLAQKGSKMEQRIFKYDYFKRLPTVLFYSMVLLVAVLINICLIALMEPLVMEKPMCIIVIVLYVLDILILLSLCIFTVLEMLHLEIKLTDTGVVCTDYLKRKKEYNYKDILIAFTNSKTEQRIEFIFSNRKALSCVYRQMIGGENLFKVINELAAKDAFLSGEEAEILLVENRGGQFVREVIIIAILAVSWILTGYFVSTSQYILPF